MSGSALSPAAFHANDVVWHCQYGVGDVKTVAIHPITKAASKITVEFRRDPRDQPRVCWPDDLEVVRRAAVAS